MNVILSWPLLKWSDTKGPNNFGDLLIIIDAANCTDSVNLYNRLNQGEDCEFIYGSFLLRIIYFFRLQNINPDLIGFALIFLSIFAYFLVLFIFSKSPSNRFLIWSVFLFCSPPIMLLFERGNIDSIIFILMVFASIAITKSNLILGFFLIAVSALVKFYTFPLLILLLILSRKNQKKLFFMTVSTGLILLLLVKDLSQILKDVNIPNPTSTAFGSPIFGLVLNKIFGFEISKSGQLLLGFAIGLVGIIVIASLSKFKLQLAQMNKQIEILPSSQFIVFFLFSTLYIILMFTGMNFVYRLILGLPAFLVLLMVNTQKTKSLTFTIFGGVWISYQFKDFQLIGDLMLFFLAILLLRVIPFQRIFTEGILSAIRLLPPKL